MMISLVLALTLVLVATCRCDENMRERHGDLIKFIKECHTQHGFTDEVRQNLKKEFPDGLYKPEGVPKEYLCTMKCLDEKLGLLKDGKYEMNNLTKNDILKKSLKTPEKYLKCLEDLDEIKDCEDYRKKVKCDVEVGDTYIRVCASKFNIDERKFSERQRDERSGRDKNHQCFEKCMYESKGILDKDGRIVIEKAQDDVRIMWRVKNKDRFLNCLKDLEIKECEHVSKICECKKK